MAYRVIITPPAQRKLDDYVFYTLSILKNGDAAKSILDDTATAYSVKVIATQCCG